VFLGPSTWENLNNPSIYLSSFSEFPILLSSFQLVVSKHLMMPFRLFKKVHLPNLSSLSPFLSYLFLTLLNLLYRRCFWLFYKFLLNKPINDSFYALVKKIRVIIYRYSWWRFRFNFNFITPSPSLLTKLIKLSSSKACGQDGNSCYHFKRLF